MIPVLNTPTRRFAAWMLCALVLGAVLFAGSAAAQSTAEGNINGTIRNEAGEPVAGADVNVISVSGHQDTTNTNGEYRIEGVPYGEQNLEVTNTSYNPESKDNIIISTTNSPVVENFTLVHPTVQLGVEISASPSSQPVDGSIPGATVNITHTTEQNILEAKEGTSVSKVDDDDDGEVEFDVTTGQINIDVKRRPGYYPNETTVTVSGSKTAKVLLDTKTADVTGTVNNTRGDVIPGATVSINVPNLEIYPNITDTDLQTQTGGSGTYSITGVPRADIPATAEQPRTITANAPTFSENSKSISVIKQNIDENVTLQQEFTTVTGQVTNKQGAGLNGVTVEAESFGTDTTNSDGQYSLSLPIGTHNITVGHPDYRNATKRVDAKDGASMDFSIDRTTPVRLSIDDVSPRSVQKGDTVTITYSLNETVNNNLELNITGPEPVDDSLPPSGDGRVLNQEKTVTIPEGESVQSGTFNIQLSAPDLGVTKTDSFGLATVTVPEETGALGEPVRVPAGDFVSIPTGGEYMIIGGDKRGGEREQYLDILRVSGGSTVVNTRLLGTNVTSARAYGDGVTSYAHSIGADANASERAGTPFEDVSFEAIQDVSSLAGLRKELNVGARSSPLQVGRYQLVAGADGRIHIQNGDPDFVDTDGVSSLILKQRHDIGDINTYVLPPASADENSEIGDLLGEATQSETVAMGERILIEVPAYGMWGATLPESDSELTAEQLATLLERHEGVHIEFDTKRLGGPNNDGGSLQFESVAGSDLNPVLDRTSDLWSEDVLGDEPTFGGYYLVIDTRGIDPFDTQPDNGDVLQFDMSYRSPEGSSYQFREYDFRAGEQPEPFDPGVSTSEGIEHFPYFGDDAKTVRETATMRFVEPSITYARTRPNGELLVSATSGGQIVGSTTMVPGTEIVIRLLSQEGNDPAVMKSVETTVTGERTFSASGDFSGLTPGQEVDVELATNNRLKENRVIDSRDAIVVNRPQNPARFNIGSFPDTLEVKQRASLEKLEVRITNDGTIVDRQMIHFRINGEPIRNESVLLNGGGSTTLDLSGQFVTLPTGTYQYTVATEDDTQTGQLTVTGPDSGTVITEAASQGATTSSAITGNAEESGETTGGTDDGGDSGEPSGLFSLVGVRTRDVAVATAIAGATHILGYWT